MSAVVIRSSCSRLGKKSRGAATIAAEHPSLGFYRLAAEGAPTLLFVENENPDTAGHYNDAAGVMRALWAFDEALKLVLDFRSKSPGDTLVIVTGDHETGGLSATYAWRFATGDARLFAGTQQDDDTGTLRSNTLHHGTQRPTAL